MTKAITAAIPAVRFYGSHRYFRETRELITEGLVEVRDTIGFRSGWFECRDRLWHAESGPCSQAYCHGLVCTRPDSEDAGDDSSRPPCRCIRCTNIAPRFAHKPRAVRNLKSRAIGGRRR